MDKEDVTFTQNDVMFCESLFILIVYVKVEWMKYNNMKKICIFKLEYIKYQILFVNS